MLLAIQAPLVDTLSTQKRYCDAPLPVKAKDFINL
jgi:hypothetical protein